MADLGLDQVHLADAALILLEGGGALESGDQTRSGRSLFGQPALSGG
jgi:hypothetical protein